jgi:hypothetical protein
MQPHHLRWASASGEAVGVPGHPALPPLPSPLPPTTGSAWE